ncbi:MAG TPA: hypothetical protein VGO68_21250 [Pyrinomonadaceae bacterium]|jgi:hypothetical protein|nr:hypothetical protein [Pyrinomonadaceae bacterium]
MAIRYSPIFKGIRRSLSLFQPRIDPSLLGFWVMNAPLQTLNWFEVLYPGQYRRTIKSVRLTIPCVAGPYTNISARLTLKKSSVEKTDGAALDILQSLPASIRSFNYDTISDVLLQISYTAR